MEIVTHGTKYVGIVETSERHETGVKISLYVASTFREHPRDRPSPVVQIVSSRETPHWAERTLANLMHGLDS